MKRLNGSRRRPRGEVKHKDELQPQNVQLLQECKGISREEMENRVSTRTIGSIPQSTTF